LGGPGDACENQTWTLAGRRTGGSHRGLLSAWHVLGHDRIQYVVAFLGFFMIFAMWLFPEVKREETAGGVQRDGAAQ
jgi:hypothetical protein